VYFGPQTKKLLTLIYVHPNGLFSGDYISTLRGCCALKFLHALKIDQALLAHTPRWDGVPQKIYNRENLKFGLKFSVLRSITSSLVGISSWDFFQSTLCEAGLTIWVQFLQCPPPKICDGQTIVQISARFLISFDFDCEYPQNGSTYRKSEKLMKICNLSHVGRKTLVYFGPQTKKLLTLIHLYLNGLFSGDYILALRGLRCAAPSNFYTRYRLSKAC